MNKTKTGQFMPASDQFRLLLRSALKHLYDPSILADSPLVRVFDLAGSADPASALRQTLTRAIRALQPEADMPADAQVWRIYEALLYRYVQRSSQQEVAEQLGMSIRHLGRLERQAIQVLATRLRQQLGLPGRAAGIQADQQGSAIGDELAWLAHSGSGATADLASVLSSVLDLVQPMAAQRGVILQPSPCSDVIPLAIHPVALRQILLSLLGVAIRQVPGQRVSINVRALGSGVEVQVQASKPGKLADDDGDIAASLEMARRLLDACGGQLTLRTDAQAFVAAATLPAVEPMPVLAIDDNANTLQLLQRYASNTRYRIIPATSLAEALALARESAPRIIVLDVMMPEVDGWEVLGRLRQHPLTSHIPVIVCTILAEEELALSLGASSFLRKPVSREGFLGALDQVGLGGSESR